MCGRRGLPEQPGCATTGSDGRRPNEPAHMILVTGSAGFIGQAVCAALLARGERVVGLDNFNDYYDPQLKRDRVDRIASNPHFSQIAGDIADRAAVDALLAQWRPRRIVHLAAQAGVGYLVKHPEAYVRGKPGGFVNPLGAGPPDGGIERFVCAAVSRG